VVIGQVSECREAIKGMNIGPRNMVSHNHGFFKRRMFKWYVPRTKNTYVKGGK